MNTEQSFIYKIEKIICNFVEKQIRKHVKPTKGLNNINEINLDVVKELKQKYGIGGLILDVDGTLRKNMSKISDTNIEWVKFIKKEFKIVIVSNGLDSDIEIFSKDNEIKYIGLAKKPFKKNFLNAANEMGLNPENILVIGDDIVCDIWGGNRCSMFTALIDKVIDEKIDEER